MRRALLILSIMAAASLFNTEVFASVNDNQVTSQKIKEADGTSGQDTNNGSGVKTGHIQDGAVTTGKVADNAVTATKLADQSVTTDKLADYAVTDEKISGPISSSKISNIGLNADSVDGKHSADLAPAVHQHNQSDITGLDSALAGKAEASHNHDTSYQKKYSNLIVVSKSGGDFTDPLSALNSITDPSVSNQFLVKIMPGVYDIGTSMITMKNYVDIEGSGQNVTTIQGTGSAGTCLTHMNTSCLIMGAANSEIRNLLVQTNGGRIDVFSAIGHSQSGGPFSVRDVTINSTSYVSNRPGITVGGLSADNIASVEISNVKLKGTSGYSYAIYGWTNSEMKVVDTDISGSMFIGILNYGTALVSSTTVSTSRWGSYPSTAFNNHGTAHLQAVTLTSGDENAICNVGGSVTVDNSSLKAPQLFYNSNASTVFVGNSKLDGATGSNWGTIKCFNAYDGNYDPRTCP